MLFPDFLNLIEIQVELGSIQGFIYMCNDLFFSSICFHVFLCFSHYRAHALMQKSDEKYTVDNREIPQ